jgi:hypothetical protein
MKANKLNQTHLSQRIADVCIGTCQKLLVQIEKTKQSILASYRDRLATHDQVLRLALNEAEALAWQTGFPQLVFPTLALEKAQAVATWHERQSSLRRNATALALAV